MGNEANSLSGLLSIVSINGGTDTAATTTANAGTPVATTVTVGNTVNLNDQGDSGNFSYGIGTALLTRTGAAAIGYTNVQTLVLNSSAGNDIVQDGAATLPTSTPAPVNLNGGPSAAAHVIINGNSIGGASATVDTINLVTSAATTATEANGGSGNDIFNVTSSPGLGTAIDGGLAAPASRTHAEL